MQLKMKKEPVTEASAWRVEHELGDWNTSLIKIERGNVLERLYVDFGIIICCEIPIPFSIIWLDQDFRGSSSGYAVGGSSRGAGFNDDDDMDE
ncbi:hypothetical protein Tco_0496449 [Tanacetum coccineum]